MSQHHDMASIVVVVYWPTTTHYASLWNSKREATLQEWWGTVAETPTEMVSGCGGGSAHPLCLRLWGRARPSTLLPPCAGCGGELPFHFALAVGAGTPIHFAITLPLSFERACSELAEARCRRLRACWRAKLLLVAYGQPCILV